MTEKVKDPWAEMKAAKAKIRELKSLKKEVRKSNRMLRRITKKLCGHKNFKGVVTQF